MRDASEEIDPFTITPIRGIFWDSRASAEKQKVKSKAPKRLSAKSIALTRPLNSGCWILISIIGSLGPALLMPTSRLPELATYLIGAPHTYHSKSVKLALLFARALPSEREYLSPFRRPEKTARQWRSPPRRVSALSSCPRQSARGCR